MKQILFYVGNYPIYAYGTALAIAFIVGMLLAMPEAARKKINPDHIVNLAIILCISAIIGGRLLYVLLNLEDYTQNPVDVLNTREGGLSFYGGLLFATVAGILYCKITKISGWVVADIVAPFVALGYSIVRIGCLLNGCCFGYPTDLPWALKCSALDHLDRHPSQIYSSLFSLLIFAILLYYKKRTRFDGQLMFLYVGLYPITRFVVEFFREGDIIFMGLTLTQVCSVIISAVVFLVMSLILKSGRAVGPSAPAGKM